MRMLSLRHLRFVRRHTAPDDFARAVLDNLPYAVIAADRANGRLLVNRRAHELSGAPPDPARGEDWPVTYRADDATPAPGGENPLVQALHGERVRGPRMAAGPDERSRTAVWVDGVAVRADDGRVQGAVVVMRELDDDPPATNASRLAGGVLEHLAVPVAVFAANSGELVYTNGSWNRMFGYADGEAIEVHISAVHRLGDEERPGERLRTIVRSLQHDARWSGRLASIRTDGVEFWCTVTISRLADDRNGDLWIAAYPPSGGV